MVDVGSEHTDDAVERWRRRAAAMRDERFSARVYDAGGSFDRARRAEARAILEEFGAVHVVHTGLSDASALVEAMPDLGFAPHEQFSGGGRTSSAHQEKWVLPGLRRMDHYPAPLYLLANNEVQYQRATPERVLFFCARPALDGGRTFLHSARAVEEELLGAGALGVALVDKLARHGVAIETGFLDRRHPLKAENTFQSWQERWNTDDAELALARASEELDEGDRCWWHAEDARDERDERGRPLATLMTRVHLDAFMTHPRDGRRYLRFPRLALDGPSTRNGHRRFPLGNGEELTAGERALLLSAYLVTREGIVLSPGDVILFDNIRYGHSRESFSGERDVYVGMAGLARNPGRPDLTSPRRPAAPTLRRHTPSRFARPLSSGARYELPPSTISWAAGTSARVFDAEGSLGPAQLAAIRATFERHGAVHVRRTGLERCGADGPPSTVLEALGFGAADSFPWGGLVSGRTMRRALSRELRATDEYPSHLWLLPHNEVLYQRFLPARLLFFGADTRAVTSGGRTFVHCAERLEAHVRRTGPVGESLLSSLREHGLLIEMGFLDERHPQKARNYFRSWQDRFETSSPEEAVARCRAATHQFDECWWHHEDLAGGRVSTLMTRIRVPAFHRDARAGNAKHERMLFPRIALDGPAAENGFRRYTKGNGDELSDEELDVLLSAFLATREGIAWEDGDLLLVDNLRYGHSRESFVGRRTIGVAMAGRVDVVNASGAIDVIDVIDVVDGSDQP